VKGLRAIAIEGEAERLTNGVHSLSAESGSPFLKTVLVDGHDIVKVD